MLLGVYCSVQSLFVGVGFWVVCVLSGVCGVLTPVGSVPPGVGVAVAIFGGAWRGPVDEPFVCRGYR